MDNGKGVSKKQTQVSSSIKYLVQILYVNFIAKLRAEAYP